MKVDLSIVLSAIALGTTIFGVLFYFLSNIRLRGTVYRDELHRVELDQTRAALESDMKRMYEEIYRDRGRWDEINHLVVDMAKSLKWRDSSAQISSPIDSERFLKSFGIDPSIITISQNQVFILTPLNDEEVPVTNVVHAACDEAGLRAIRGDESKISGSILPVVIKEIVRSRFVIANINGRNPNVFYEMGIAQALGKDILMFCRREDVSEVPFDLAQQHIIFYRNQKELRTRMRKAISQLGWETDLSIHKLSIS